MSCAYLATGDYVCTRDGAAAGAEHFIDEGFRSKKKNNSSKNATRAIANLVTCNKPCPTEPVPACGKKKRLTCDNCTGTYKCK